MTMPSDKLHDRLLHGDSTGLLARVPDNSIDLIVTDPKYLVNYRGRDGRTFQNDDPRNAGWIDKVFPEMHRILKSGKLCVSFYGWNRVDQFMESWRAAGLRPVGHLVWHKPYASRTGYHPCHT